MALGKLRWSFPLLTFTYQVVSVTRVDLQDKEGSEMDNI